MLPRMSRAAVRLRTSTPCQTKRNASSRPASQGRYLPDPRRLANLEAAAAGGEHFAWVEERVGVEEALETEDQVERFSGELARHQLVLFHADAVLACDRAARFDAPDQDLFARRARLFEVAGLARVEENDRVQVAIAGVEDVADGEAVALGDFADELQCARDPGAGHDAILHVIRGADAPHGAECVLAALPQQIALLDRARHAKLARAARKARIAHLLHRLLHGLAAALQFDPHHRLRVQSVAR